VRINDHRHREKLMATSDDRVARVLALLAEALESPDSNLPSTRLLLRPHLKRMLLQLKDRADVPADWSGLRLLNELFQSRVLQTLSLDAASPRVPPDRFVVVGFGEDQGGLNPLELLQVHSPRGTVCYFSALMVHELTTQTVAHHHISTPVTATQPSLDTAPRHEESAKSPPLGNWQFTYRGTPYYTTRRDSRYLTDSQRRPLDKKSWFQVTSLEQTLLDTLHRPMSCGGLTVVFDAWEAALLRVNGDRLIKLVRVSHDHRLARRVGFMADRVALSVAGEIYSLAEQWGAFIEPAVALFGGIPYTTLDRRWNLRVP
jgi:hypothetical protein